MDASSWDKRYESEPVPWGTAPAAALAERIAPLAPGRAVDLACGDGRHAHWLAERGWQVTGVDFSPVAIDRARATDPASRIDWHVGDVTDWAPTGSVDLVVMSFLHLPMAQLVTVLARAGSWLSPTGRLLYLGHARENHTRGVGGPPDPTVLPDIDTLARGAHGLRVWALHHVLRPAGDGTAIDVILDASPWALHPHPTST
ncbi:MAG: class I SAM-dependent methyltransferase [Mycobacteriaceae bacterium]